MYLANAKYAMANAKYANFMRLAYLAFAKYINKHTDHEIPIGEDKNVLNFMPPEAGGPSWKVLRIRQMFDAPKGYMIEIMVVILYEKDSTMRLPMVVTPVYDHF